MNKASLGHRLMRADVYHGHHVINNLFHSTYVKAEDAAQIAMASPSTVVKMVNWLNLTPGEFVERVRSGRMKRYLYIAALNQALPQQETYP